MINNASTLFPRAWIDYLFSLDAKYILLYEISLLGLRDAFVCWSHKMSRGEAG